MADILIPKTVWSQAENFSELVSIESTKHPGEDHK